MNNFTKIWLCIPLKAGLLLTSHFSLLTSFCFSQNPDVKRTYHWYFGNKAGLDFTNNNPVPINNSAMETPEGCSSISDTCGILLFYTDGDTVWNKNNLVMQNGTGLGGCKSSTQSALIVPQPGNDSLYYIFTTDCMENPALNGLRYSIVNINLSAGLGAVTQKNILLFAPASEKLTATYHTNGTDVWILSCSWYPVASPTDTTYKYYAYLLSASGINPTSIISPSSMKEPKYTYTYMNFSHNGNKVANNWHMEYPYTDSLEIFDFDKTTGTLSNLIRLVQDTGEGIYGLVFSPDDSKLYISVFSNPNVFAYYYYKIYQYDVSSNDSAIITASKILIHLSDSTNPLGTAYLGMQTASDGKIYIASVISVPPWYPDSIDVIANPNAAGLACNYIVNGVYLGSGGSEQGLPNFVSNYFVSSWQPVCNVGIKENVLQNEIFIYSNPFSDYTIVKLLNKYTNNIEVKLFDTLGNTVQQFKTSNSEFIIQRNNLPAGMYFLKIQTQDKVVTQKLIIQ